MVIEEIKFSPRIWQIWATWTLCPILSSLQLVKIKVKAKFLKQLRKITWRRFVQNFQYFWPKLSNFIKTNLDIIWAINNAIKFSSYKIELKGNEHPRSRIGFVDQFKFEQFSKEKLFDNFWKFVSQKLHIIILIRFIYYVIAKMSSKNFENL